LQPDTAGTALAFRRDHHAERYADARPCPSRRTSLILSKKPRESIAFLIGSCWKKAIEALRTRKLSAVNLSEVINPKTNPTMTYAHWLVCGQAYADPRPVVGFFKRIKVRNSDFEKWRRSEQRARRPGPARDTTGYQASDRKLFPEISRMIESGDARSAYGAALRIADKIAGRNSKPESRAIRLSALYRKELPESR